MSKVYPQEQEQATSSHQSERQTYTLWMKSLVLHSNGCTVYDSSGHIVYRVDNYDRKGGSKVNLMDLRGKVLCTIKKRLLALGCWEGLKHCNNDCNSRRRQEQPWFQVKRCNTLIKGKVACEVKVGCQNYCIVKTSSDKAAAAAAFAFRIVNKHGQTIAEAKQKLSPNGVVLSNDVLSLDLAAGTDHSLIMALVTVYGLMCGLM